MICPGRLPVPGVPCSTRSESDLLGLSVRRLANGRLRPIRLIGALKSPSQSDATGVRYGAVRRLRVIFRSGLGLGDPAAGQLGGGPALHPPPGQDRQLSARATFARASTAGAAPGPWAATTVWLPLE
jgi:hypothetical protein